MQGKCGGKQGYDIARGGQVPNVEKFYLILSSFREFLSQGDILLKDISKQ